MLERSKLELKPMELYKAENVSFENINVGDFVVADIYSYYNNTVIMKVSGIDAKMDLEDIDIFRSFEENRKFIVSQIGKRIIASVKEKQDKLLILERNTVVKETYRALKEKIGSNITATVGHITSYGLFMDIGNGVQSLLHISEISKSRFSNLESMFGIGEIMTVKLIEFIPSTSHFRVSRKQAYEKANLKRGMVIQATCSISLKDRTGIYVECDPATTGIMDVPENMSDTDFLEGDLVRILVTNIAEKGFRCDFLGWV